MKAARDLVCCALLLAIAMTSISAQEQPTAQYQLSRAANGGVIIERGGKRAAYQPVFIVIRSQTDPQLGLSSFASTPGESLEGVNVENYPLPRWRAANGAGMTDVVYDAGSVIEARASDSRVLPDGGVAWSFEPNEHFTLEAEVSAVTGEPPRISWRFTARTPGWYTVGYTGAPAHDPAACERFLQPLIWQEKRFPRAALTAIDRLPARTSVPRTEVRFTD